MRTQIGLGPQVTPTERSLTRDLIYKQRKTNEKKEKKLGKPAMLSLLLAISVVGGVEICLQNSDKLIFEDDRVQVVISEITG